MIDNQGFRANVGIIVANGSGEVLWARRRGQSSWQFPQGGVKQGERDEEAVYRELYEEVGLKGEHVQMVARTSDWLHYKLPPHLVRRNSDSKFVGQKQKWFLLKLIANDGEVRLDTTGKPEFDHWRWVSYWYPVGQIVAFKREVYRRAMRELSSSHSRLVRELAEPGRNSDQRTA